MLQRWIGSAGCVLFSAATALHAQAWDTITPVAPSRSAASPVALSPPDSNGFWTVGHGLVHYHADGSVDFARDGAFAFDSAQVVPLADGSVVFATPLHSYGNPFSQDQCEVKAVSAAGTLLWDNYYAVHGPAQFNVNGYCQHLALDGGQGLWLRASDSELFNLGSDGAPASASPVNVGGVGTIADFVANPQTRGACVLIAPARVISLDRFGAPLWVWTDPDPTHTYQKIALGAVDGNLYLAGRSVPPAGSGAAGGLLLASVNTSGTQRFVAPHADYVAPDLLAFVPAPNGAFYLADFLPNGNGGSQLALQRIAADGSVQWSRSVLPALDNPTTCSYFLPDCGLTVSPEGDALLIASQSKAAIAGFYRYDAAGNALVSYATNPDAVSALQSLPNGNALLAFVGAGLAHASLLELDRSGKAQPAPVLPLVADDAFPSEATFAADGSTYVVATGQTHFTLSKIGADGSVAWVNGSDTTGAQPQAISSGGDRVCVQAQLPSAFGSRVVSCFSTADGTHIWTTAIPLYPWRVLADGSVVGAGGNNPTVALTHIAFDRNGTQLHNIMLPPCALLDLSANGTLVCFSADYAQLVAYDKNATALYSLAVPAQLSAANLSASVPTLRAFDDGSALIAVTPVAQTNPTLLWSVSAQGNTRFVQTLDAGSTVVALAQSSDTVYAIVRPATASSTDAGTLQARALADGGLRWQVPAPYPISVENVPIVATGARVLVLGQKKNKLGVTTFDAASGATLRAQYLPCGGVECSWTTTLGSDGTLRAVAAAIENGMQQNAAFALHDAAATPAPIRVGQAGVDGAWYPTYAVGQGFWIDYLPSASYLMMPWFTYATSPLDDPSALAWYSLQGSVPSGATSVDLGIGLAAPGTFDSGTVALTQVGTAHLSFTDCNSATLLYQFSGGVNGNAGGLMSLSRLTPSTADCQLADGSTTPAAIASVPAQGFDARSSGTWYDPATSGQGLQLTVLPPATGFAGEVFAGWFTFDPPNAANDAQRLQWFTLQGDLSTAANGKVTLAIAQTLGGSLDGSPTSNTHAVGSATLTFTACDKATLDFQFSQDPDAHAFAGISGTESLSKIGGCGP